MDNVLFLDNRKGTSQLMKDVFGTSILHDFHIKDKFPGDIKDEIEGIFDDYAKEKDLFEADKSVSLLYLKAENHDVFRIIKFAANLIDEVSEEEIVVPENHLTVSFIHLAMKVIFKKDTKTFPHV
ncbi:uncharacterized protein B0P05DRAFT_573037 [Gilbertella persicaria]|uniref:uncharacterized protein n=1 Tax=Gilbertella persicaria TaxID=101096 RepID=UPI00221E7584|nr:uncharacterized protein B0P05DRAFT_573037 [Gilbertella persicaria]KAI8073499.1 hypothetical protein B0P05DRAFT_573037 [Gilbertella persicaria]